jgi:CcmD family protein
MMKMLRTITLTLSLLLCSTLLFAQQKPTEMADLMRSNGRIYVVVAVMVTILAGLVFYVARLDKKISKLEKDQ